MRHFVAFLKKEILEYIRTYKLFIMLIVFSLFGIMNPLAAKLTPYLIENLIPEGNLLNIPEPTALDSWAQFFKNINQMGLIVTLLVFSLVLVGELSKGTLINMLTKGLSRKAVILSKYAGMVLLWTVSVIVSFFITWIYTVYLFPDGATSNLVFSVFCIWLYGACLLAILLLASTIARTNYASLILVGLVVVALMLVNIVPKFKKNNPLTLSNKNMDLLAGTTSPDELYITIGITIVLIIISLIMSISIFRKNQI